VDKDVLTENIYLSQHRVMPPPPEQSYPAGGEVYPSIEIPLAFHYPSSTQ